MVTVLMLDLFAGIGGFTIAAHRVGLSTAAFVEINPFCRRVLAARFPGVPIFEDIRAVTADSLRSAGVGPITAISGGWPCQDLSVAGNRAGLAGERSGLFWELIRLVGELRPDWIFAENVPGLRSSWSPASPSLGPLYVGGYTGGKRGTEPGDYRSVEEKSDLAEVLLAFSDLGYRGCYRSLDAQFAGLAQRRERLLFVLGLGAASRRAVRSVLTGGEWYPAPRRKSGERVAYCVADGTGNRFGSGRAGQNTFVGRDDFAPPLAGNPYGDHESREGLLITHSLTGEGFDASEDGTGRGTPIVVQSVGKQANQHGLGVTLGPVFTLQQNDRHAVCFHPQAGGNTGFGIGDLPSTLGCTQTPAVAFNCKDSGADASNDLAPTMRAGVHSGSHENGGVPIAIAWDPRQVTSKTNRSNPQPGDPCCTLHETGAAIASRSQVRRLTPTEAERLQGFSWRETTGEWQDGHTCLCGANRGRSFAFDGNACTCPDGPRYRALGNAVAVPVVEWIMRKVIAPGAAE